MKQREARAVCRCPGASCHVHTVPLSVLISLSLSLLKWPMALGHTGLSIQVVICTESHLLLNGW